MQTLWHWQEDSGLAGIRDAAALAKLPADEQKAFAQLWADVEELLTKADGGFHALPAAEQFEQVRMELKKRNPGFDGNVGHKIEGGVVTELNFGHAKNVTDLSPVRALVGLKVLGCFGAPLSDLSPLKGMLLTSLDLRDSIQLRDLSPLKGMPLVKLELSRCAQVRDVTPLKGMPLTHLSLNSCATDDLAPLKGMPLTHLDLLGSRNVQNLEPLKGMSLVTLYLNFTHVRDLAPLKGMPLKLLMISETGVTDLRPLQGVPLEDIRLTPRNITQGLDILHDMKSLKTIGIDYYTGWPAAEFWDRYDKGEFNK